MKNIQVFITSLIIVAVIGIMLVILFRKETPVVPVVPIENIPVATQLPIDNSPWKE